MAVYTTLDGEDEWELTTSQHDYNVAIVWSVVSKATLKEDSEGTKIRRSAEMETHHCRTWGKCCINDIVPLLGLVPGWHEGL